MTYRQLKKQLHFMSEVKLDCDITVVLLNTTEVIPVEDHIMNWEPRPEGEEYTDHEYANGLDIVDGVLDDDHPYFTIDF